VVCRPHSSGDRASASGAEGRRFESYWGHHRPCRRLEETFGEILREDVLAGLGLTVSEAAKRLGVSSVTLSRVIHEHAAHSPNLSYRLELAGAGTARLWLDMQTAKNLADQMAADTPTVTRLDTVA